MATENRIDELILLAEKGMGWRGSWKSDPGTFYTQPEVLYALPIGANEYCCWRPFTHIEHAAMLICALGIRLAPWKDASGQIIGWAAAPPDDRDPPTSVDGNTPAVIAHAVTECALRIVRARAQARAEEAQIR